MIEYVLLTMALLSFISLLTGIIYCLKMKRFEDERMINPKNILIFGLFFLLLHIGVNALIHIDSILHNVLTGISANIPVYIQTLNQISNAAFIPLFAICILAGMLVLKEI